MKSSLHSGKLIKWKDDRGFGFIQSVDGSVDIFLHISEIKDATRRPQVGDTIYYSPVAKDGKICATNAFILGAREQLKNTSLSSKYSSNVETTYPFPLKETLLLSVFPLSGAIHFAWITANLFKPINILPLILYLVMSPLTFILYADDKSRAQSGKWRTSEEALHLFEFFGGWLGGFIAQRTIRHKSRKSSYQIVFWAIVIIHHIFWLGWLFFNKSIIR